MSSSPRLAPGAPQRAAPGAGRLGPEALAQRIAALLALEPDALLALVGGGCAEYFLPVVQRVPLRFQAIVVDASAERLQPFLGSPRLRLVPMEPQRFARYPMQSDRMVVDADLLHGDAGAELARALFERLQPAGRLLALGRPDARVCDGLVAWPPARHAREDATPRALRAAGFAVTSDLAPLEAGALELVLGVKAGRV